MEKDYRHRKGDFIHTYSGNRFYALDPRPEDINELDIAHGLAKTCRFSGQCDKYYSVAQHSVVMADWLLSHTNDYELVLWALLHDAAEAYVTDVPRPIKKALPEYRAIEDKILETIAVAYGLSAGVPQKVKELDKHIVADEALYLFDTEVPWVNNYNLVGIPEWWILPTWDWERAKTEWLSRMNMINMASAYAEGY